MSQQAVEGARPTQLIHNSGCLALQSHAHTVHMLHDSVPIHTQPGSWQEHVVPLGYFVTRTRMRAYTHACAHTHACMHTHTHACTHTHTHTWTETVVYAFSSTTTWKTTTWWTRTAHLSALMYGSTLEHVPNPLFYSLNLYYTKPYYYQDIEAVT